MKAMANEPTHKPIDQARELEFRRQHARRRIAAALQFRRTLNALKARTQPKVQKEEGTSH